MEIQMAGITEGGAGMENKRSMGSEYEKKAAEYLLPAANYKCYAA